MLKCLKELGVIQTAKRSWEPKKAKNLGLGSTVEIEKGDHQNWTYPYLKHAGDLLWKYSKHSR